MATWYVRPTTSHSATRPGTSYAQAFGTWAEILWASISAGDTLELCGTFDFASGTLAHTLGANSVTTNPLLLNSYLIKPTSPLIETGRFVKNVIDYQNTWFNNPPSVGAFEPFTRAIR